MRKLVLLGIIALVLASVSASANMYYGYGGMNYGGMMGYGYGCNGCGYGYYGYNQPYYSSYYRPYYSPYYRVYYQDPYFYTYSRYYPRDYSGYARYSRSSMYGMMYRY